MYQVIKYNDNEEVSHVILYNESDIMKYCDHEFARELNLNISKVKDASKKKEYDSEGLCIYLELDAARWYLTDIKFRVFEI